MRRTSPNAVYTCFPHTYMSDLGAIVQGVLGSSTSWEPHSVSVRDKTIPSVLYTSTPSLTQCDTRDIAVTPVRWQQQTTLTDGACIRLSPHYPHLLSDLGETRYKSAHNARQRVSCISAQGSSPSSLFDSTLNYCTYCRVSRSVAVFGPVSLRALPLLLVGNQSSAPTAKSNNVTFCAIIRQQWNKGSWPAIESAARLYGRSKIHFFKDHVLLTAVVCKNL
jgi:hypothetical protein